MTAMARPWREMAVQLLATVMIPVSVAGTGLYYTRWQQNLNDLKTMSGGYLSPGAGANPEPRLHSCNER